MVGKIATAMAMAVVLGISGCGERTVVKEVKTNDDGTKTKVKETEVRDNADGTTTKVEKKTETKTETK